MTRYADHLVTPVVFDDQDVEGTLAELVAAAGLEQLHVAETEKYAHVTYFLNGGREQPWPGERRQLIPSPTDVATYDQRPEMSARAVADAFAAEIAEVAFGVINFANPDMVGHTGVIPAAHDESSPADRRRRALCWAPLGRRLGRPGANRRWLPRNRAG